MTFLLDGNVLVALIDRAHVHHDAAVRWFAAHTGTDTGKPTDTDAGLFATCPITQGTLMRMLLRFGAAPDAASATSVLRALGEHPRHVFWPDVLGYADIGWAGVLGHRQVTDRYLVALARHNSGRVATFDRGLAALHPDDALLIDA